MNNILFDLTRMSKSRLDTTGAKLFAEDGSYLSQAETDPGAASVRARRMERRWALEAWLRRLKGRKK